MAVVRTGRRPVLRFRVSDQADQKLTLPPVQVEKFRERQTGSLLGYPEFGVHLHHIDEFGIVRQLRRNVFVKIYDIAEIFAERTLDILKLNASIAHKASTALPGDSERLAY